MSKTNYKHKTIGVSLSPVVRERANRRSRQLGVSFSRYMSLCVEAEIAGFASLRATATVPEHAARADYATRTDYAFCAEHDACTADTASMADTTRTGTPDVACSGTTHHTTATASVTVAASSTNADCSTGADCSADAGCTAQEGQTDSDLACVASGTAMQIHVAEGRNIPYRTLGSRETGVANGEAQFADRGDFLQRCSEPVFNGAAEDIFSGRGGRAEAVLLVNEWLLEDVADLLLRASVPFLRKPSLGGIRADFLIQSKGGDAAKRTPACSGVVVECRHPAAAAYTVMLGRAVMLQQMHGVQAVILCVPYLSAFDRAMIAVFERQSIGVTTPDMLLDVLAQQLPDVSM